MIKRIIRSYLFLFVLFYISYAFLNWLLTVKTGWVTIDKDYSNFWIPFLIIYIPVFFVMRPLVKKWGVSSRDQDGVLWALIPFTISIPTAFSQQYFKDLNYKVVSINHPIEVHQHPTERFFKVKHFYVNRNDFTLFKERHVSGGKSKTLKVNNYYIAPMFQGDHRLPTGVAYGLKFSTSLNHGLLFRDEQPKKIWEFNIHAASEFGKYDLDSVAYFEKQVDSEDAVNYADAWQQNELLDKELPPVVLVGTTEPFQKYLSRGKNMTLFSVLISLTVAICVFMLIEYFRR